MHIMIHLTTFNIEVTNIIIYYILCNHKLVNCCFSVQYYHSHRAPLTKDLTGKRGHRGHDHMVVGFTTTYAISAYHH